MPVLGSNGREDGVRTLFLGDDIADVLVLRVNSRVEDVKRSFFVGIDVD